MSGYSNLYKICQNDSCCSALTSNRHFLEPNNPIYFCNNLYINERLNLKPSYWGGPAWTFLYSVAEGYGNYPTMEEKREMYKFISSLNTALPCKNAVIILITMNYQNSIGNIYRILKRLKEWISEMERRVEKRKEFDREDMYNQENYNTFSEIRKKRMYEKNDNGRRRF